MVTAPQFGLFQTGREPQYVGPDLFLIFNSIALFQTGREPQYVGPRCPNENCFAIHTVSNRA